MINNEIVNINSVNDDVSLVMREMKSLRNNYLFHSVNFFFRENN